MLITRRQPFSWLIAILINVTLIPIDAVWAKKESYKSNQDQTGSEEPQKPTSTWIEVPATTGMVILVNFAGEVSFLDRNGRRLESCQLCTLDMAEKYGQNCEEAKDQNICRSTTNATVRDHTAITLRVTEGSPPCVGASSNGDNTEQCMTKEECEYFKGLTGTPRSCD